MKITSLHLTSLHLLTLCALITGCHRQKPPEPSKNVVRVVAAESLDSGKRQARSEYIAMLRGDAETDLSFKVGGVLELMGRTGETQDWQEGARCERRNPRRAETGGLSQFG